MQHRSHFSVLSEAWVVICSKRTVFVLATFLMFLSGIIGLMEEYVPLYYSWNGFKTEFVTVMLTVGLLGATFIQMLSHFFDRFHQRILFGLVLLAGVVLFSTHYFLGWAAVLGFYAFMRILKLMETSLTARMHTLIDTDARSTAMSLVTFVAEITGIVFAGMLIFFQYYYSDIMSVALLGAATALISLWFVVVKS